MTIHGVDVKRGQSTRIQLNIAKLPTGTVIDIPVFIHRGKKDGPTLLLLAGMHGDEVNGIEIIRRMNSSKLTKPQAGTVITIPVLNIYGFINYKRDVPDGKDVNRSFPGNKTGSLASRVAYMFMKEIFPHISVGVDFHTGGGNIYNYPQIRCKTDRLNNLELAKAFAPPFILNANLRPKSLRSEADKRKVPMLVYEGGEALMFNEFAMEEAIKGTARLMHYLGMTDETHIPNQSIIIKNSSWIRARQSGLFKATIERASKVVKDQMLGYLTDPYGESEVKIKAPRVGHIIAINHQPVVNQGDALIHIGME